MTAPGRRSAVRIAFAVTLTAALVGSGPLAPRSDAQVPAAGQRPLTIPALQEWVAGSGTFTFGDPVTVRVSPADRGRLRRAAQDFAADLSAQLGRDVHVVIGDAQPAAGDVVLQIDKSDRDLGPEGYRLAVQDVVSISAPKPAGVFYGAQSVLQLAHQSDSIPAGVARDWPRYEFRGFMLDNGRKFYTPDWIKARIREIAYLKYNVLHLHFSDNQGFRIESESHPEVVTQPALTKDEVREIIALAGRYHITVVPEIDSPGHMQAALRNHPELQITRSNGQRDPGNLNFIDPAARRFVRELLEEYLALFPGEWWHLGGDEFVFNEADWGRYPQLTEWAVAKYGEGANHYDAFYDYINWLDDIVTAHGRRSRIWAGHLSGKYVSMRPTIAAEVWHRQTGFATPQELLDAGNTVLNSMYYPNYYVLLPQWYVRPDNKVMADWYENWEPWEFDGDYKSLEPDTVDPSEQRLTGAKFHVWSDSPDMLDQEQVASDIAPRFRVAAQKLWFSPPLVPSWAAFTALDQLVGEPPAAAGDAASPSASCTGLPMSVPRARNVPC